MALFLCCLVFFFGGGGRLIVVNVRLVTVIANERKRWDNKMKNKTYHSIGTVLKSSSKTVEREEISISLTHKYMTAHKCGGVKLALCDQTSPFNLYV
jgi:hypothetical protein